MSDKEPMLPESERRRIASAVFELVKRNGPMCLSQISAELVEPPKNVSEALGYLQNRGLVVERPDAGVDLGKSGSDNGSEDDRVPWGIPTKPWATRQAVS